MVHQYKSNGYNIVLDTASGSVHMMDDLAYDMTGAIGRHANGETFPAPDSEDAEGIIRDFCLSHKEVSKEAAREVFGELHSMHIDGELFSPDIFSKMPEEAGPTVIKAACLNVSHDCNLSCKYCFAGEGEYHGSRSLMSYDTGKKALEFLCEHSGNRKNLEVDFFGGEPLMNLAVVKDLVQYGRGLEKRYNKHFRFTLTTNGVLLDEAFYEFADRELDNVVLSLDGRQAVHDNMRPKRGGQGSYETVVKNILDFVRHRGDKKHYIRGTYTRDNLDFSRDILHLADLGFKEISMEPVVAPDSEDYAIRREDIPELIEEYDTLAMEMVKRQGTDKEFSFFHFMIDLTGGPCVYKRLAGCGAGTEYVAITPDGDIYPCHQFVGMPEFVMGNVTTGIENTKRTSEFKEVNVYTKPDCKKCFAAMYCSGGCLANAYNATGSVNGTYEIGCELERKRVECAIMLEVNKRFNKS